MTSRGRDLGTFDDDFVEQAEGITDTRIDEGDLEARPADVMQPDAGASERPRI